MHGVIWSVSVRGKCERRCPWRRLQCSCVWTHEEKVAQMRRNQLQNKFKAEPILADGLDVVMRQRGTKDDI